jgi:hypothetical protein
MVMEASSEHVLPHMRSHMPSHCSPHPGSPDSAELSPSGTLPAFLFDHLAEAD